MALRRRQIRVRILFPLFCFPIYSTLHTYPFGYLVDLFLEAISAGFGGDCTRSAIDNRFRKIKTDAILIRKAIADGVDPFTLPIGEKGNDAAGSRGSGQDFF